MDIKETKHMKETKLRQKCITLLRQNLLVLLTLVGVGIGFLIGFTVGPTKPSMSAIMWIGMPGELYIRMLKLMIVPLVVCSVISGTSKMDPKSNGRISGFCIAYIMLANCLGTIIGAMMCFIIKPGVGVDMDETLAKTTTDVMETEDIFADLLRNIIPENVVSACFQQAQTKYEYTFKNIVKINGTSNFTDNVKEVTKKYVGAANSTNILGLIILCSAFGIAAAVMKEEGEAFLSFFRSSTNIILRILRVLIWSTPVGVASLIAKTIASTSNLDETFQKLGKYFLTIACGLIVWGFVLIPIVFLVVRRQNPIRFLGSIAPSMMIVFATGST